MASDSELRSQGKICAKCGQPTKPMPRHMEGERYCEDCLLDEPRPYRVLMNFQHCNSWTIHFMAEDCKTTLSRFYDLPSLEAMYDLVRRTKPPDGTLEDLESMVRRWSRGSIYLNLTEAQYRKLKR